MASDDDKTLLEALDRVLFTPTKAKRMPPRLGGAPPPPRHSIDPESKSHTICGRVILRDTHASDWRPPTCKRCVAKLAKLTP
jgi:hypothetical protein